MVPVALLVMLAVIGLLGAAPHLEWNGEHATVVGIALEAVLAALLVATFRRGDDGTEVARKLRLGLKYLLIAAMVALAVAVIVSLHLHLASGNHRTATPPTIGPLKPPKKKPPEGNLPSWLIFVLLIPVLIAAILGVLNLRFRIRRRPGYRPPRGSLAMDPESLRDALSEGAAALRDTHYDDARKAIIACYVAMERSLVDKGTEKTAADTPDELLARATAAGLIHGAAASTLTGLFYEARFSTHPLGADKRERAVAALDGLMESIGA